jgi:hypothetical protein
MKMVRGGRGGVLTRRAHRRSWGWAWRWTDGRWRPLRETVGGWMATAGPPLSDNGRRPPSGGGPPLSGGNLRPQSDSMRRLPHGSSFERRAPAATAGARQAGGRWLVKGGRW